MGGEVEIALELQRGVLAHRMVRGEERSELQTGQLQRLRRGGRHCINLGATDSIKDATLPKGFWRGKLRLRRQSKQPHPTTRQPHSG
jgi:hypothetical protein